MAKVWRNSEGREFPAYSNNVEICGVIEGCYISPAGMSNLGYELVDSDPEEEFEVGCFGTARGLLVNILAHPKIESGEVYSVRKVKR